MARNLSPDVRVKEEASVQSLNRKMCLMPEGDWAADDRLWGALGVLLDVFSKSEIQCSAP